MCLRDILTAIHGVNRSLPNVKRTPRKNILILIIGPVRYTVCPSVWRKLQLNNARNTFYSLVSFEILTSVFLKVRSSGMWRWVIARLVHDVSDASQSHEPLTRRHDFTSLLKISVLVCISWRHDFLQRYTQFLFAYHRRYFNWANVCLFLMLKKEIIKLYNAEYNRQHTQAGSTNCRS